MAAGGKALINQLRESLRKSPASPVPPPADRHGCRHAQHHCPENEEPDVPDPLVRTVGIDLVLDKRPALVEPAERLAYFSGAAGNVDIPQPEMAAAAGEVPGPRARPFPVTVLIGRNDHARYTLAVRRPDRLIHLGRPHA